MDMKLKIGGKRCFSVFWLYKDLNAIGSIYSLLF